MNYLVLGIIFLARIVFADCTILNIVPGRYYEFECSGNVITEKCTNLKGLCEFKLNEKLRLYNAKLTNDKIENVTTLNKTNASQTACTVESDSLICKKKNNCSGDSSTQSDKIFNYIQSKSLPSSKDDHCTILLNPISIEYVAEFNELSCRQSLEQVGIEKLDTKIESECPQVEIKSKESANCKINSLIKLLNLKDAESGILKILQGTTCKGADEIESDSKAFELNKELRNYLIKYLKGNLDDCRIMEINKKNIEQLVCFKIEEFKFEKQIINNENCSKDVRRVISFREEDSVDKSKPVGPRNIAGQPEKENFTLPTEAPTIKNQETLQKIDKLIADNGGEVTPEIAKQAGAIFNSGVYQPTKDFINNMEKAISDRVGTSSGSSSSSYRSNKNGKSYEIGSKGSSARGVANVTEEVTSAAQATKLNNKMPAQANLDLENDTFNGKSVKNDGAATNRQNDNKFGNNNYSSSTGASLGGAVAASSTAGASNVGSSGANARHEELPSLPSLSSAEKSEIAKVVQALKGAESSEDVKSIVTGEDNYAQVKRIIQELEQRKKGSTQSRDTSGRNPASASENEVKEFEKTLEKFGIKVYGEAGPGKAVYAPQSVNHVIVLKNNSIQFLNTIRSKK